MPETGSGSRSSPGLGSWYWQELGLARLFGSRRPASAREAGSSQECAFRLAGRAEELFSVFPPDGEEAVAAAQPSQGFGIHLARALDFRLRHPDGPWVVGLLGAGGCGKSTLFNLLAGRPASQVDILPHTTRGPVGVASPGTETRGLLAPLSVVRVGAEEVSRGDLGSLRLLEAGDHPYPGVVLVDLPDLNTESARLEGALTAAVLPWLDAALLVYSLESFDREVLDRSLDYLKPLGCRLLVVFNRKGSRGKVVAADRRDLEERARTLGAGEPFYFPDLRQDSPPEDDRARLVATLGALPETLSPTARREGLRATMLHLGRLALDRHDLQADRAEGVRRSFEGHMREVPRRMELDPLVALASDPREVGHVLHDLSGLIGNPMELIRRLRRGQSVTTALSRTFSIRERLGELERTVASLKEVAPATYVDRMRSHFANIASGVSHAYSQVLGEEANLFLEPSCRHDLVEVLFEDRRAAVSHGFVTYRDETVSYMEGLKARIEGSGSLETAITLVAYAAMVGDIFFMPGTSVALIGGGWVLVQVLGSDFAPVLRRHREFRRRQGAGLRRAWDLLAAGLEDHFLRGNHHFGRLSVLAAEDRASLHSLMDRLEEAQGATGGPEGGDGS